jgi:ribosome biogenesis ATPase
LEDNVHKTYVDVEEMTQSLMNRYQEYARRKLVPFRILVEQGTQKNIIILCFSMYNLYFVSAYKTVLHSYGLDSNPGSDAEAGSDLEVMDVS